MLECSLTIIPLDRYASHHSQIIAKIINRMKYFLMDFRNKMKNKVITSNARIAIHARDRVDTINSQNITIGNNWSFRFLFLRYHNTKTGKNAINRNPKLVGLSNKKLFLTFHLSIKV